MDDVADGTAGVPVGLISEGRMDNEGVEGGTGSGFLILLHPTERIGLIRTCAVF